MARPDGVVIVSERYWAFAGVDGSLREGRMPKPPELVHRLPLARGLVRLWASLAPVFRRRGVARPRERLVILAAILGPLGLAFLPSPWPTLGGIVLSVALPYLFSNLSPVWALANVLPNAAIATGSYVGGILTCTDWNGATPG